MEDQRPGQESAEPRPEETAGDRPALNAKGERPDALTRGERLAQVDAQIAALRSELAQSEVSSGGRRFGRIAWSAGVLATAFVAAMVILVLTGRIRVSMRDLGSSPPEKQQASPIVGSPGLASGPPAVAAPSPALAPTQPPSGAPAPAAAAPSPALAPTQPPSGAPAAAKPQSPAIPTSTPPATVAATAVPPAVTTLRSLIDERFADNQRNWPNDRQSTSWFADGAYRLMVRQPGEFVALGVPMAGRVRDPVVTATFRKIGGPPGGGYGLIVLDQGPGPRDGRGQEGIFHVLEAGDRGEMGVWRREGDRWIELVPWTRTEAVRPGESPNELTARVTGSRILFSINGIEVWSGLDERMAAEGSVGVFVGGDLNEVALERLLVQVPE
jgi:hypothetical protein